MNQRICDIFDNMIEKIPNQKEADESIEKAVYEEIKKINDSGINEDVLKDLCFSVVHIAKRQWFAVGFYYAIDLICKRK